MFKLLWHICRSSTALVLCLILVSCDIPQIQVAGDAPEAAFEVPGPPAGAWIDAPLTGAEAPPGTTIKVIGHVDPDVGMAMLYINGANSGLPSMPIPGKNPPAYEWQWTPGQAGVYELRVGGTGGPLSSIVRVTITGKMAFKAEFWADQTSLKPGECTSLHWITENALNVLLHGETVEPQGDLGICPEQDETHVLQVQYKDNSSDELTVNIIVVRDTPTPTPTSTSTPTPTMTMTYTITPTRYVPATTTVPPRVITTTTPPRVITTTVPPADTNPPPAPSGLSPCGTRGSPALVLLSPTNLSWTAVKDASGISQYMIVLHNVNAKQTTEYYTSSTSFSVNIQVASYNWHVSAQDGAGNWSVPSQQCYFYYTIVK
jgi:hypothetical protein